jgi:hypothetical protein
MRPPFSVTEGSLDLENLQHRAQASTPDSRVP